MTKDIKDITASIETHWNRAVGVMRKTLINQHKIAVILSILDLETGNDLGRYSREAFEHIQDIGEILDGLKMDIVDLTQSHIDELDKLIDLRKRVG